MDLTVDKYKVALKDGQVKYIEASKLQVLTDVLQFHDENGVLISETADWQHVQLCPAGEWPGERVRADPQVMMAARLLMAEFGAGHNQAVEYAEKLRSIFGRN